jgi:hypothetical protein
MLGTKNMRITSISYVGRKKREIMKKTRISLPFYAS